MRLADYIIETLAEIGINEAFLITGRGALFLTDAVAKSKHIEAVCHHNEQAASYAAGACAQLNNKHSLCLVSTGCASTNSVTGVLNAYQDGLPVVYLSGQNILAETTGYTGLGIRTYGQQEANIVEIVTPITKYAVMITRAEDIRYHLEKALYLANSGIKGPVWLDVPLDLQSAQINPEELKKFEAEEPISKSTKDVDFIKKSLSSAERPVILIGSGIRSAGVEKELKTFAERNEIPVAYTGSSPDIYPLSNYLSVGSVGSMGSMRSGAFAVQNCDLLLVLGNRLNSMISGPDFCNFARSAKKIVVDIDPIEHSKVGLDFDKVVECDLKNIFTILGEDKLTPALSDWVAQCLHWKKVFSREEYFSSEENIDLYDLTTALSRDLADDAIVVTDSGLIEVILPNNLDFGPNRRAIHPVSQGSMGFSIPGAIGVAASARQTVVIVGDGSFMMNIQELETIRANSIPVKIIVVNNNIYSIIRRRQKELFRRRTIGTDNSNGVTVPDFSKVADTFGMKYFKIDGLGELDKKLASILAAEGQVLCEVIGKSDQEYIEISHARNSNGKFVRRPLEDQWPFMDRELFAKEMIIETID